jgi:hypothetical protein
MAEAIHTISQSLRFSMSGAVMTLARQQAEKAVKQEIRDKGVRKVSQVKRSEIAALGREYLAQHPELIAQAKPVIEAWRAEGVFGKRAQLALERNSQDTFTAEVRG